MRTGGQLTAQRPPKLNSVGGKRKEERRKIKGKKLMKLVGAHASLGVKLVGVKIVGTCGPFCFFVKATVGFL